MKCRKLLLVAAGWLIFPAANSLASDIKVIANSSVRADAISSADLRRVFLEERISLADGSHVGPVLEKGGPVHTAFLEYLGISNDDLQAYYRTLVFTGKGSMPREFGSDAEVVAYVARTRGAIGYVSGAASTDYPDTLKRLNIGGTVRLRVSISAKGNVENVQLLGGNPILGESATVAVKKWVYAAGKSRTIAETSISFGEH